MPSLNELVRGFTSLDEDDLEWLHVLVSDWQLLADLSFADLLLYVPVKDRDEYIAVAQMRPTTGPTAYPDDLEGSRLPYGQRPLLDAAFEQGRIMRETDTDWREDVPVRLEAIPVRRGAHVIGVILRNTSLISVRTPSRLELTYIRCASDLAKMIAAGRFPHPDGLVDLDSSPRVGDGLVRLDADGVVSYASPNALSAYHHLGLPTDIVGLHLGRVTAELAPIAGPVDEALEVVASGRAPREIEVATADTVVHMRAIPLEAEGVRIGAIMLVRDVTELRRREQELLTKDATIREIHHRVKNNLQTVAALLRLQSRRLEEPLARAALDEAVRRVGSIAIVHETLSLSLDERVDFDEIADRVMTMVGEVASPEVQAAPRRTGTFGVLPAEVATPLALVLTELMQNALEHGLADKPGLLEVAASRSPGRLHVVVTDDGKGLPEGFDPETSGNLGLQIVRTLAISELGGSLDIGPRPGGGTRVGLDLPLPD